MTRRARREHIAALASQHLGDCERVIDTCVVWAARLNQVPLLFRGRHLHDLALTDSRLLVFEHRRRNVEPVVVLDEPLRGLRLERTRNRSLLHQVVVATGRRRRLVFEFRVRDHAVGRALVRAVGTPASRHPVD